MSFKLKFNIGNFSSVDLPVYNISNLLDKTFTIDLKKQNSYFFILKDPTPTYDYIQFTSSNNEVSVSLGQIDLEDLKKGATVNITTNSQDSVEATITAQGSRVGDSIMRNIGTFKVKFIDYIDGYEYVDLGLPSGTLWAKCNVGATTETDYGLYFAWGETQGYTADQVGTDKNFSWNDYKFNPTGDGTTFTKYNSTDGKTTLDLEDDAAHFNMGGRWVMPTQDQIQELLDASNTTYTVRAGKPEGVIGMEFTSVRNGNTLLIPFAGHCTDGSINDVGSDGNLWPSSLCSNGVDNAFCLVVDADGSANLDSDVRYCGYSVRGVCTKESTGGKTVKPAKRN